jgi:hypothetical protein
MPVDVPVIQPPAIYRNAPSSWPLVDEVLPFAEVNKRCREWTKNYYGTTLNGCQRFSDGKCWVIRVDSKQVLEHEIAHCNGWPKEHPGGVWLNLPPLYYGVFSRER